MDNLKGENNMYQKHSNYFEEVMTYIFIIGFGTIGSILIARLYGIASSIDLLTPMMGGLLASSLLCFKYYFGYRKAEAIAIAKAIEYRKKDIRSWCKSIHKEDVPWLAYIKIEGARRRERNEELQQYYY